MNIFKSNLFWHFMKLTCTVFVLAILCTQANAVQLKLVGINKDVIKNSTNIGEFINQFPEFNGGVLPKIGQDGSTGFVAFFLNNIPENPVPLDPILNNVEGLPANFANLGPLDLSGFPGILFYNIAIYEFYIDGSKSDVTRLRNIFAAAKLNPNLFKFQIDLTKEYWYLNSWVINPELNAINPLFATCKGSQYTVASAAANNGWVLTMCNIGGNIVPNWVINKFFLNPKPFIDSGQIKNPSEFKPFGIRIELLPFDFPGLLTETNTVQDVNDTPCNGVEEKCASNTWIINVNYNKQ